MPQPILEQLDKIQASYQTLSKHFSEFPWLYVVLSLSNRPSQWPEKDYLLKTIQNYRVAAAKAYFLLYNNQASTEKKATAIICLKTALKLASYVFRLVALNAHDIFTNTVQSPARSEEALRLVNSVIAFRRFLIEQLSHLEAVKSAAVHHSRLASHFYEAWMSTLDQYWPVLKCTRNPSEIRIETLKDLLSRKFLKMRAATTWLRETSPLNQRLIETRFFEHHNLFVSFCADHAIQSTALEEEAMIGCLDKNTMLLQKLKKTIEDVVTARSLTSYRNAVNQALTECSDALQEDTNNDPANTIIIPAPPSTPGHTNFQRRSHISPPNASNGAEPPFSNRFFPISPNNFQPTLPVAPRPTHSFNRQGT
ncbi:MAG: hypothetical protein Q8L78_07355 [Coxiellaceae bacterium]|nr:hypothetical protein [Coxiellaceae bacterium]